MKLLLTSAGIINDSIRKALAFPARQVNTVGIFIFYSEHGRIEAVNAMVHACLQFAFSGINLT